VHGWLGFGHWQGPVTRLGWLGPAQPKKKILNKIFFKIISKNICDFLKFFTAL